MNNMQKRLVIIGITLTLLNHSSPLAVAFNPFVRPHYQIPQPIKTPQIKYYQLDISTCKNCSDWVNEDVVRSATLNNEEFEQMKKVLLKSITRYNLKTHGYTDSQITGQYGVQYLPYIDKKGKKQILINGFCVGDGMFQFQKPEAELVIIFDGGSCFFNTRIRADSKKAVSIGIHGSA